MSSSISFGTCVTVPIGRLTSDGRNKLSFGTVNYMQQEGESVQKFSVNFLEQVKAFKDSFGPLIPTKEMYKVIERTRTIQEGDEECDETYEETVLASESEILEARNKFVACLFLAGVDRKRYKDAIDEMNNDYLRHGKEYPNLVQAMVVWLTNDEAV